MTELESSLNDSQVFPLANAKRVEPFTKKCTKGTRSSYKGTDEIRSIEQNGDYRFENIKKGK